jgi:PAT family beta-lactamase induction signal transducer AmpG
MPYAMIAATLTTRLAQDGITKSAITAFSLAFLAYNLKWAWAWIVDGVRLPVIGRLGQRVSWLLFVGTLVIAAVVNLALVDPTASLMATAVAAILVAVAGATYDVVIDAYRIEWLEPHQLGVGSGMSQYGWRIGSVAAASLALVLAARVGWEIAYAACALFALPAMAVGLILGEPPRHRAPPARRGFGAIAQSIVGPFVEFLRRRGALLVLLFVLVHKVGDTLANLTFRLLFDELAYTNDEIALYDVGVGFWALLAGIFVGGALYARFGLQRSLWWGLWLMAVSNLSFAGLAATGHSNLAMAGAIGFENFASGIGGVVVVAYFSALCDLRYTAAQFALMSAALSVIGRIVTGASAGALIERLGYVEFYLLTTVVALPGIVVFWLMVRGGYVDSALGTVATSTSEGGRGASV